MNKNDGYFWLGLAPRWIKVVTAIGTLAMALPGLQRIDSVMISGSDDWNVHGPVLMAGLAYLAGAVLVLVAGLALGDILRLLLRWEAQLHQQQREIPAAPRAQPVLVPLPSSQALLQSLGISTAEPTPAHNGFHPQRLRGVSPDGRGAGERKA